MGAELRTGDVTTATDSITMYARYCELRAPDRAEEAAGVLKEIEDYNHYDCRSTRRLRDWLLTRALEAGVPPMGPQPAPEGAPVVDDDELAGRWPGSPVTTGRLAAPTSRRSRWSRPPAGTTAARTSRSGGHHFDRLNSPVDEWAQDPGVFLAEHADVDTDWQVPPRARKRQRRIRLTGAMAAGELGRDLFALYAPRPRPGCPTTRSDGPTRRCGSSTATTPPRPPRCWWSNANRRPAVRSVQLPFALTPGAPLPTKVLREAIDEAAADGRGRPADACLAPPSSTSCCAARRAPARRRCRAPARTPPRHHRRAAGPGLVVPGGARPARHRQDPHRRAGDRRDWSTTIAGGSAWWRSRTRWWRTCCGDVIDAGVDPSRVGQEAGRRRRVDQHRGEGLPRRSSPTTTGA